MPTSPSRTSLPAALRAINLLELLPFFFGEAHFALFPSRNLSLGGRRGRCQAAVAGGRRTRLCVRRERGTPSGYPTTKSRSTPMPQRAATIERLPMAFEVVKAMQTDGLEWGKGYRPLGRLAPVPHRLASDRHRAAAGRRANQTQYRLSVWDNMAEQTSNPHGSLLPIALVGTKSVADPTPLQRAKLTSIRRSLALYGKPNGVVD